MTKHGISLNRKDWTPEDRSQFRQLTEEQRVEWYHAVNGTLPPDPAIEMYTPTARRTDPVTSHIAAATQNKELTSQRVATVLAYLRTYGAATQKRISQETGIPEISCSSMLSQMRKNNLVKNCGTGPNPGTGRMAMLWEVSRG